MRNKKLQPAAEMPPRKAASASRLQETVPVILETPPDDDYALIDSGNGLKLERYGPNRIIRPEAQAIWQPALDSSIWQKVDAEFTGDTDEEGMGRWRFSGPPLGETWPMQWDGLHYYGRFTSFRHVGVFPEQAAHWRFVEDRISQARRPVKLLNLFGYTGLASLVAARAGAHVTHVDASKKAVAWARDNQQMSGLDDKPIRWIVDDAVKFCEREVRRGNHYDAILLDPPKYGRGPKGEVWQFFEDLPHLLDVIAQLTNDRSLFVVLTAYSIRSSFFSMHEICQEVFGDKGGRLESGELVIISQSGARRLSTSLFTRWIAK